jgi:hypothetical protein
MTSTLTLSCGSQITLNARELEAWEMLTPESRWEVMQFSPTAAHIILSAERPQDEGPNYRDFPGEDRCCDMQAQDELACEDAMRMS